MDFGEFGQIFVDLDRFGWILDGFWVDLGKGASMVRQGYPKSASKVDLS